VSVRVLHWVIVQADDIAVSMRHLTSVVPVDDAAPCTRIEHGRNDEERQAVKTKLMLCPVVDLDSAVAFYRDVLGLPVKFRDGDRYCALDAGGYTLGLIAGEERIVDQAAPVFQVDALESAMEMMLRSGATTLSPAERGPHEVRAVLRAPGGGAVVLSAPL